MMMALRNLRRDQDMKYLVQIEELGVVERWFGDPDPAVLVERYEAALEALRDTDVETWLQDASRMGFHAEANISGRFRADWLTGARIPGLAQEDFQQRMRDGFNDAIETAREARLPLSIIVTTNSGPADGFAVEYTHGANAVTVVLVVPLGGAAGAAAT